MNEQSLPNDRQPSASQNLISESEPKRGRGRPRKNPEAAPQDVTVYAEAFVPDRCPSCGCTEYRVIVTIRHLDIIGDHNGFGYNKITWRRCMCKADGCKQKFVRKFFRMIK